MSPIVQVSIDLTTIEEALAVAVAEEVVSRVVVVHSQAFLAPPKEAGSRDTCLPGKFLFQDG